VDCLPLVVVENAAFESRFRRACFLRGGDSRDGSGSSYGERSRSQYLENAAAADALFSCFVVFGHLKPSR
jgi:hypothetical protein